VRPVTCPLRVLTVSQLSRRAKENPVRGEWGQVLGGAAHRDNSTHARAPQTIATTGLLLIVCPEPDTEIVAVHRRFEKGSFGTKVPFLGTKFHLRVTLVNRCFRSLETQGGVMTTLQAMCLGTMLAWTPSLVVLALLFREAPLDELERDPS